MVLPRACGRPITAHFPSSPLRGLCIPPKFALENRLREREAVAVKEGWEVVERFIDQGISGSKGREGRPAFDRLRKGIVQRDFDLVAARSVDRLGRSLHDLVAFLNELRSKHTNPYLHKQGIDTTTRYGIAICAGGYDARESGE
ncbi:MAG: recombinase family protein [Nitrospiraceae bacterium]|nr:recombinase family protein [Nitrospiraceae bacterium]